ncbi:hypothetical protein [Vibrio sp. MA40-2]|uniref:hypothetical protein n=1 Tax=Vibrio sp. MA40-2 TaxID=3391828 RepID=UPI0039A48A40
MKVLRFTLITLLFAFWSNSSVAVTQVSFDGVLDVWRASGNRAVITENCNAYTGDQGGMKVVIVNERCNLLHFSMFVFYNECQYYRDNLVKILGKETETLFIANDANCNKVYQQLPENKYNQNKTEIVQPVNAMSKQVKKSTQSSIQSNNIQYVIQFYSGFEVPNLKELNCRIKNTSVKKINGRYYLMSGAFNYNDAKMILGILKNRCDSTAWIRPIIAEEIQSISEKSESVSDTTSDVTEPKQLILSKKKQYVIQFYSGRSVPDLDAVKCKIPNVSIKRLNDIHYIISDNFVYNEAKMILNTLKKQCDTSAWIRPFPIQ